MTKARKLADSSLTSPSYTGGLVGDNLEYTGTLTGGTGIVNLGSGQFYKDADGKFGFGRVSSASSRAIIRGLGTTSATKSLIIENSGGSETVVADDAGTLTLPTSTAFIKGGDTVGRAILSNSDSTVYAVAYGSSHATSASSFVVVTGTNKVTTVDASGNFGLGVAPSAWGASWRAMEVGRKGSALFSFSAGDNTYLTSNCYFNGTNWIYAYTSAATNYNMAGGVHKWSTAPSGTAGNPITFTQAMTLDASGNLLVGTTTQRGKFTIEASSGNLRAVNVLTGASTIDAYTFNGTGVGSITTNGVSVAFNTTSDHRLKTNVRPANAARFCDIEFVDFEWTDGRHDCGLIAHQLASVYPDLVIGEKDATEEVEYEVSPAVPAVLDDEGNEVTPAVEAVKGTKTQPKYQQVNYMGLIARMGTVVQRHEKTIEAMQTQLDDQNAAMQMLASRLAALEAAA